MLKINKIRRNEKGSPEFKPLEDYKPRQQALLRDLLSDYELRHGEIKVYASVLQKQLTYTDDFGVKLWDTLITIVAFLITDNEGHTVDRFLVPANPFRIRLDSEYDELLSALDTQYELIKGEDVHGDA